MNPEDIREVKHSVMVFVIVIDDILVGCYRTEKHIDSGDSSYLFLLYQDIV